MALPLTITCNVAWPLAAPWGLPCDVHSHVIRIKPLPPPQPVIKPAGRVKPHTGLVLRKGKLEGALVSIFCHRWPRRTEGAVVFHRVSSRSEPGNLYSNRPLSTRINISAEGFPGPFMTFLTSGGYLPTSMIKTSFRPIQTSLHFPENHCGIIIFPYGMPEAFWMVYRPRIWASRNQGRS